MIPLSSRYPIYILFFLFFFVTFPFFPLCAPNYHVIDILEGGVGGCWRWWVWESGFASFISGRAAAAGSFHCDFLAVFSLFSFTIFVKVVDFF